MNVENFERLVVAKSAHFGFQSVQREHLDTTLSTLAWWEPFDEDNNNSVDFTEFVSRYPSMVRVLLRRSVRESGAQAFFEKFAVEGKFTHASILAAVAKYGLHPLPKASSPTRRFLPLSRSTDCIPIRRQVHPRVDS